MCLCIGMPSTCGARSRQGIALAGREGLLAGIGVDTWGVDFGLLNHHGRLIGNPYHYRDGRTDGMLGEAFRRLPQAEIFAQTGIQFLQLNSLYQLLAMAIGGAPGAGGGGDVPADAEPLQLLAVGRAVCEFSIATTTQCYDPQRDGWARPLLQAMGIPTNIFPDVIPPGTVLGPLHSRAGRRVGRRPRADHRACVPRYRLGRRRGAGVGRDFAWISSGTWSVMGAELAEPLITPQSLAYDFTNEGGTGDTFASARTSWGCGCCRMPADLGEPGRGRPPTLEWTEMATGALSVLRRD